MSGRANSYNSVVRELVGAEILLIDQDERVHKGMTQLLSAASLHVTTAKSPEEGYEQIKKRFFSVIVIDLDTPGPNQGLETTRMVNELSPISMVVMLTPRKSYSDAVRSIRSGAVDIVLKSPDSVQYLKDRVMEAAGRSVGKREVESVLTEVRDTMDEFLKLFMAAERRAQEAEDRQAGRETSIHSDEVVSVLVVDENPGFAETLAKKAPSSFVFDSALSGGQALDKCGSAAFQMAMVAENLHDLPGSMVVRSIKVQHPELMALSFQGPGPGGYVKIIESTRDISVLDDFQNVEQLIERLDELSEAFRVKSRERRFAQAFRERHYDFLRRFVELKSKIDRV